MRRRDLILKQWEILVRRRAVQRRTLSEHTSMIATNDRVVGDSVDAALDGEQDEVNSQLATVESRELAAIDAALQRICDGRYGICDMCNQPISVARLQALPFATLCINCQRDEEHSGRRQAAFSPWERLPHQQEDETNRSTRLELELA